MLMEEFYRQEMAKLESQIQNAIGQNKTKLFADLVYRKDKLTREAKAWEEEQNNK